MTDEPENMVLELLREMRIDMREMKDHLGSLDRQMGEMSEELNTRIDALQGITIGLGHYVHALDDRIGTREEKIGA